MNRSASVTRVLKWIMVLLLVAIVTGCGGGNGGGVAGNLGFKPVVTATSILPMAVAVPFNIKKIAASFTMPMDPATIGNPQNFTLECPAGHPVTGTTVSYQDAGNVAILMLPAANLPQDVSCVVVITTGVMNTTGIPLTDNFVWTFTTGVTADVTAPTVTGTINSNGATNVAINTKVGATFSKAMDPATITPTTFTLKQGATVVPGTVTYTGLSAIFTPTSNLAASTPYTATLTTGTRDAAGNALASDYVWSWTTAASPDIAAPTVTGTIHANGASSVPINTAVGATFSEAMDPLTINNLNFTLTTDGGAVVPGITSYTGVSAVFRPLNNLASSTHYNVTVKGGVGGVKDVTGNPMVADFMIGWTTAAAPDTTPPTVTGTINANGALNVPINTKVSISFSEGIDPLTVTNLNFLLKETLSGNPVAGTTSYSGVTAIFIPLNNLSNSMQYSVTIKGATNGFKDLAGNPMVSDYVWSWTTAAVADTTPPAVSASSPAELTLGVCINKAINATFSKPLDPLTITNATFTLMATTGASVSGVVAYDLLTNIATFSPLMTLTASTHYTATVKGGINGVKDILGNSLALDKVTSFTTGTALCTTPIALGAAASFGGFGGASGMTNSGINTVINADIGTTGVSTTMTGFHDSVGDTYAETLLNIGAVNGRVYTPAPPPVGGVGGNTETFAIAAAAAVSALKAYGNMSPAALPGGVDPGAGQLGGITLYPGIYKPAGAVFLLTEGDLTLDAQGDTNAVWVFQTPAGLTIGAPAAPRNVILINGAKARNVFWYVGSSARIEDRCSMVGTIIAGAGVTISTAGEAQTTMLEGRALGLGASVTMVNTLINLPAP